MAISWYHSSTCTAGTNIVPGDSHSCYRSLGMTWFSVVFRKDNPGCYPNRALKKGIRSEKVPSEPSGITWLADPIRRNNVNFPLSIFSFPIDNRGKTCYNTFNG